MRAKQPQFVSERALDVYLKLLWVKTSAVADDAAYICALQRRRVYRCVYGCSGELNSMHVQQNQYYWLSNYANTQPPIELKFAVPLQNCILHKR